MHDDEARTVEPHPLRETQAVMDSWNIHARFCMLHDSVYFENLDA